MAQKRGKGGGGGQQGPRISCALAKEIMKNDSRTLDERKLMYAHIQSCQPCEDSWKKEDYKKKDPPKDAKGQLKAARGKFFRERDAEADRAALQRDLQKIGIGRDRPAPPQNDPNAKERFFDSSAPPAWDWTEMKDQLAFAWERIRRKFRRNPPPGGGGGPGGP